MLRYSLLKKWSKRSSSGYHCPWDGRCKNSISSHFLPQFWRLASKVSRPGDQADHKSISKYAVASHYLCPDLQMELFCATPSPHCGHLCTYIAHTYISTCMWMSTHWNYKASIIYTHMAYKHPCQTCACLRAFWLVNLRWRFIAHSSKFSSWQAFFFWVATEKAFSWNVAT